MSSALIRLADSDDRCAGASEAEIEHLSLWRLSVALCLTDGEGNVYQRQTPTETWDVIVAQSDVPVAEEPMTTAQQLIQRNLGQPWSLAHLYQANGIQSFEYRDEARRALVHIFVLQVGVIELLEARRYAFLDIQVDRACRPETVAGHMHANHGGVFYERLHAMVDALTVT